ncbi:TPA: haloacid dehalogenase type II, partial [Klebsiella pneumoniae]|nr:haloacid dehalogenase type II [Klebsiella pneumoniae]
MTDDSDTPETKGILFFDVNETLLDTASLKEYAGKRLANRQDLTDVWFTSLLHYSLVETVTGSW